VGFGATAIYKMYFCAQHPLSSGPSNPPIQRVSWLPSSKVNRLEREDDNHTHAILRFRMRGSVLPLATLHRLDVARD
jgi:hypothetical protein